MYFPELFRICCNKDASVADLMQLTNGVLHWDVNFMGAVQEWELESLLNFMDVIYGASVKGNGEDKLCYRPNKKNGFVVSGYYRVLLCFFCLH